MGFFSGRAFVVSASAFFWSASALRRLRRESSLPLKSPERFGISRRCFCGSRALFAMSTLLVREQSELLLLIATRR